MARMLPETMDAWVVDPRAPGLRRQRLPLPACGPNDLLVKVRACGVCRTDLHLVDHELGRPLRPVVKKPRERSIPLLLAPLIRCYSWLPTSPCPSLRCRSYPGCR